MVIIIGVQRRTENMIRVANSVVRVVLEKMGGTRDSSPLTASVGKTFGTCSSIYFKTSTESIYKSYQKNSLLFL